MTITSPRVQEYRVRLSGLDPDDHCDPELAELARGFIVAGRESARFLWQAEHGWCAVAMSREADDDEAASALVTVSPATLPRGITTREAQVLTLVALGLTNGEIAGRLGTRPRTVSTQVERLLVKLDQGSRAGLAAVAVDASLIVLPLPGGPVDSVSIAQAEIHHAAVTLSGRVAPRSEDAVGFTRRRSIRLGTLAPLIGAAASDGLELVRGASIAVRELNARGGIDGREIEHLIEEVDLFDGGTVTAAIERLTAAAVDALHTNYVTAEHPEALALLADYGRPFLHTATLESQVALVRDDPAGYGMMFQTCPSEEYYRLGFATFLRELVREGRWNPPGRSVVALEADSATSRVADDTLRALLDEAGWQLEHTIRTPLHAPRWARIAGEIESRDPDVLLISHFLPDVAELQRLLAARGFRGLVYYVYAASIPRFQAVAGASSEGIVWSTVTGRYDDAMGERFQRRFALRYGDPPGWSQASAAYDQVMLLAGAWAGVRSADPERTIEHLRSTISRGLNGVYFLGGPGQAALCYPYETEDSSLGQALLIYQVQNGTPVALSPAPKGDLRRFVPPRARAR
ncbi:ABC transporter substrate-binding protein [Microbacterium sp. OR21]|uniref:ABC transporter substrate-binding protein n=1 Tax=Microbacterium sp. OR21 TaxID=3095346 RepID=UPI0039B4F94B